MKKRLILGVIIIGVVILIVIIFYSKNLSEEKYDSTKEKPIIFISSWIENLEKCQGYSKFNPREKALDAGYSQFCFDSTDIDDNNLSKLKMLENNKGILVYNGTGNYDYNKIFTKCNLLWEFNYQHVIVNLNHESMKIYGCEDKFYIISDVWPGPPSSMEIYQTNLDEEIINNLKN